MKHIILFFFFQLFFVQANYAQQIYPMFVSDNNDKVWDVLELDDLKFVITKNKYFNTPFYELVDSTANELILYDAISKTIKKKKSIHKHNFTSSFKTFYKENSNTLLNISSPVLSPNSSLLITELDNNLNILSQKEITIDSIILQTAILNNKGNLIIAGVRGGNPINSQRSVLLEINSTQGLINYQNLSSSPVFFPTALAELNNKYYLYSHALNFHIYNQNLELDTIINFPDGPLSSQKAYVIDSKMYLNGVDKYEILFSIDTNYTIDTLQISPYPFNIQATQRGYFSIDGNEEGFLFNSNTIGGCSFYNYNSLCENHFSIRKVDTTGVLQWEYYIGGDATYLVFHVTATSDGGCIVVFDRYEQFDINEDVYYIKFDADGNVEADYFGGINLYTSIEKIPKPKSFLIYPNPAKNHINIISSDYSNKFITVFNGLGQTVFKEVLTEKIDVSNLKNATYFYTIENSNQETLQKGKILKQ